MQKVKMTLTGIVLLVFHIVGNGQQQPVKPDDFVVVQDSVIVITNVTVIDGTGRPAKHHQDIVIVRNRITKIDKTGTVVLPTTAKVIDGGGKTVIPGLIMMHEHLFYGRPVAGLYLPTMVPHIFPQLYLAGGVTTMRTAGSIEANADLTIRNLINNGKRIGPTMDVSTPHIEREGTLGERIPQIPSLFADESIENWVNYWFAKGVTSVKVYNTVTREDLRRIIAAAHARKIKVTGHLCSVTYEEAAALGIDNLEHSFRAATDFVAGKKENECVNARESMNQLDDDAPELIRLMKLLIAKNVTLTFTPNNPEPCTGRELIPGGGEAALAPSLLVQLQNDYNRRINTATDSLALLSLKKEMKRVMKFYAMGGKLTVGTDPTGSGRIIPGYANQRLIELLIETGFSIEEAIKLSTLNGAIYLGIEKQTGTVEVGKKADLVLIDGDLTEAVSNIRKMLIVFKNGIGYDSRKIFDSVKGKVGL